MSDWRVRCGYCQKASQDLRRCAKCYAVYYCSKRCQRLHWPDHKTSCPRPTQSGEKKASDKLSECKESAESKLFKSRGSAGNQSSQNTTEITKHNGSVIRSVGDNGNDKIGTSTVTDDSETATANLTEGKSGNVTTTDQESIQDNAASASTEDDGLSHGQCRTCGSHSCTQACGRCRTVFYCSKACQKKDWQRHKTACVKHHDEDMPIKAGPLTDKEKQVILEMRLRLEKLKQQEDLLSASNFFSISNYAGPPDRMHQKLSIGQLRIYERPSGSMEKALAFARQHFSGFTIIQHFVDIPPENVFLWMSRPSKPPRKNVLVAFMFMYHEHVMRHGVFLKDSNDDICSVQFYLDHMADDPRPFFRYDQVRPGNYILVRNPVMHRYVDGQVGLKIEDPTEVKICTTDHLKHM